MKQDTWIIERLARLAIKLLSERLKDFGVNERVSVKIGNKTFQGKRDGKRN